MSATTLRPTAPTSIRLPPQISFSSSNHATRARSASIVKVEEVGENVVEEVDQVATMNSEWVNRKGAWLIHVLLIVGAKVFVDTLPGVNQQASWTIVNLGYLCFSYIMFHYVTGIPFATDVGGSFDDLTLWEQIDAGAQYTPAKKWLFCTPIGLFLISTHFTNYNPWLFAINFTALVIVLFPKLPQLHRKRMRIMPVEDVSGAVTPMGMATPKTTD